MSDSDFEQVHPLSAPPQLTAMEEQKELLQMMERTAKLVDVKLKIQILKNLTQKACWGRMTADEKVNYLLAVIRGKGKGKSKGEAKGKQEGKGNKGGDGVQCYRCGKMGQKAPDCWTNLFQQSKGKENLGKGKDKGKAAKGKDYLATTQQYHPTYASSSSSSGQFRG